MMNKIYVSTIAFGDLGLSKICQKSSEYSLNLEFSSNVPHHQTNIRLFENFCGQKLIHNYFPAPKHPFVINLASEDKETLNKSIEHCKLNIKRTARHRLPFYAVHAGFCIDPKISSLGRLIKVEKEFDRSRNRDIFHKALNELILYAVDFGVNLLIENNVLSSNNFLENNSKNIFLCVDSDEIIEILDEINSPNIGLLLDTGHLKVSSTSLGKNLIKEVSRLLPYVKAVHHSENDGLNDTNMVLKENYWFLPYMKEFSKIYHVVEVKNISIQLIKNQIKILEDAF